MHKQENIDINSFRRMAHRVHRTQDVNEIYERAGSDVFGPMHNYKVPGDGLYRECTPDHCVFYILLIEQITANHWI